MSLSLSLALGGQQSGDSTPIVGNCGAQAHWDWNLRQSISGPPTAFPAVPETLAEHRRYIRNPPTWGF